ncbi:hypothetical protein [Sorangium sp. So ce1024]|uniref:hypothetical protein n=1 Tax=Sorangium sp. So ce1024 TaxID=3133327 RepID=UPI003F06E679
MSEATTAAERREMREAAEVARIRRDVRAYDPSAGLLRVDSTRLLVLLEEHEEQAKEIERLRAELEAARAGRPTRMRQFDVPHISGEFDFEPDDSPRCEVCDGPARDDDPDRVCGMEDAIYACGACARKLDVGDHERDVAAIRQALEAGADVATAIDWPAFWQRRARLGATAEATEAPVRATVEWMGQEATLSSEATSRNHDGTGSEPGSESGSARAVPDATHRALDRMRAVVAIWAEADVPAVPPEPDGDEETAYDVGAAGRTGG